VLVHQTVATEAKVVYELHVEALSRCRHAHEFTPVGSRVTRSHNVLSPPSHAKATVSQGGTGRPGLAEAMLEDSGLGVDSGRGDRLGRVARRRQRCSRIDRS
jgi:hypothetical protein